MFHYHRAFIAAALLGAASCTSTDSVKPERPQRLAPDIENLPAATANAAERPSPLPPQADEPSPEERARSFARLLRVESSVVPALLGVDETDSAFWRDPEFRRRFNESFISETDVEPGYSLIERELMQQVYDLMSNEKTEDALALLTKNSGSVASAAIDMNIANIHFQGDRLDEAVKWYETAVTKHPKFRRAWSNLGIGYFRLGRFDDAIRAFTKAIETGASSSLNFGLLGFSYLSKDNALAAESAYRMALLLDPSLEDWKLGLARSLYKQRRYHDVVALTGELISSKPDRADLWLQQANAYARMGEPMRAAENFEILDGMGKLDAANLNNLADIYVEQELYDLAVRSYKRALSMDDDKRDPARLVRSARVLFLRGARDAASELASVIEAEFPDPGPTIKTELLRLRARLAVSKGASDEEARILEEIVQLDPLDGETLILLGRHSERGKDLEKAILYYERAASIEAFEADAKVRHAQLLVQAGRPAEALPLLRRAQAVKPRENIQKFLEDVEKLSAGAKAQ
jgi:tetratricopeptide (TPR) repeat protein